MHQCNGTSVSVLRSEPINSFQSGVNFKVNCVNFLAQNCSQLYEIRTV